MGYKKGTCKYKADIKNPELYNFYKEKFGESAVDSTTWAKAWNQFIDARLKMVVFDNLELTMPYRLGTLRIKLGGHVYKLNKKGDLQVKTDYGKTRKLWEKKYPDLTWEEIVQIEDKPRIYHTNDLTNGRTLHWHWDKFVCNHRNKKLYRIRIIRKFARMINEKIEKTKKYEYYE